MRDDARAARTKCRADRQLLEASRRACEDQHRDVAARHEQQDEHHGLHVAVLGKARETAGGQAHVQEAERNDLRAKACSLSGLVRAAGSAGRWQCQRGELRLRLPGGDTIRQSPHDLQAHSLSLAPDGGQAEREPEHLTGGECKAFRHHADHRVQRAPYADAAPHDGGVPAKTRRPEAVADDHDVRRARLKVARLESAPEQRTGPQQVKHGRGELRTLGRGGAPVGRGHVVAGRAEGP